MSLWICWGFCSLFGPLESDLALLEVVKLGSKKVKRLAAVEGSFGFYLGVFTFSFF